jgi:Uma2 family endonuclease
MQIPVQLDISTILELVDVPNLGHVLAMDVSEENYLHAYAELHCEWLDGIVIKMPPVFDRHDLLTQHFIILFRAYFEKMAIGELRHDPTTMRYELEVDGKKKLRHRQPDIQIILEDNPNTLTESYMDGAADIVIEIVSKESIERDYGTKFHEYERIGVREYWIIDPLKKETRFYRLNEKKAYVLQEVGDVYSSPLIPNLKVNILTFWQDKLPGPAAIVQEITKMLQE